MKKILYAAIQMFSASALMAFSGATAAQVTPKTMDDFTVSPRILSTGVEPMMMLAMSNDHQLYLKAYGDFDSVAGFNPELEYIGYFESTRCYTYPTGSYGAANAYFTVDKQASFSSANAAVPSYCNVPDGGTLWSGNFLNWATMTRIDVLRKLLYGGKRVVANTTHTILERSHLPNDAHSFVKYYNQADVKRLVPLTVLGVQADATDGSGGVTFCNTTLHDENNPTSYNNTNPPLLRAIAGNYALWASGERSQCLYQDEFLRGGFNVGIAIDNGDGTKDQSGTEVDFFKERVAKIFLNLNFLPSHAAPEAPEAPAAKLDFTVKVEACPTAIASTLKDCKQYPKGNWRPIGALQEHGESEKIKFGLVSGMGVHQTI